MPKATIEQRTELKLTPALKKKLTLWLKEYTQLTLDARRIKREKKAIEESVETAFIDADEFEALQAGIRYDNIPLKHISPLKSTLDKKLLISRGWLTTAQLEEATKTKPAKSYVKISIPGGGDEEDE